MQLNIETLSFINGGQALALALMLWYGTHDGSPHALHGLRLRAGALLLEAAGAFLLAAYQWIPAWTLLLIFNTFSLAGQVMTVVALRMLLQRPLRWRTALVINAAGWVGVMYLGTAHPNYLLRVIFGSVILACNAGLNLQVLWGGCRRRETRAQCLLLWTYILELALLVWRIASLLLLAKPPQGIGEQSPVNVTYVLLLGVQPLLASVGFLLLYNEILQRELHKLARIDPLTGVTNRLGLLEASQALLAQARAKRESIGVLLIDADHFKSINDRFGHDGGDRVLLELVANIRCVLRGGDLVGRVGGEEFLVLSPSVEAPALMALAERIRLAIERTSFNIAGQAYSLTVSIGAALAEDHEPDLMAARRRADIALYEAKRAGRNCVMIAAQPA